MWERLGPNSDLGQTEEMMRTTAVDNFKGSNQFLWTSEVTLDGTSVIFEIGFPNLTAIIDSREGLSLDSTGWAGLTNLDVIASNGTDNIAVAEYVALSVVDSAGSVTTTGGSTVSITTDTAHEIIVNGGAATQSVNLVGGVYDTITDLNHGTGLANTIHSVSLTDTGVAGAYSYVSILSDALTSLSITDCTEGTYVDSSPGPRTLLLTLNGDGPGYVSSTGSWFEDNTATRLNIHSVTAASDYYIQAAAATAINFQDDVDLSLSEFIAPSATSITIAGNGNFTASLLNCPDDAIINAIGARGMVTVALRAGQTFLGGPGQDSVTLGDGLDRVTFGSGGDSLVANSTIASFATATTTSQTTISTANLDVIKGLSVGDSITFAGGPDGVSGAATVQASKNLAGVAGDVEFARGTYNAIGETFTENTTGHDTLLTYGTTGHFVGIVLVGIQYISLPATLTDQAMILG
jgi:hypothetical protein